MRKSLVALGLFLAACAAVRQPPPTPARPPQRRFKNLTVLPATMTGDELIVVMRAWSHSLGVNCDHCHVEPPGQAKADFISDAKPEKNAARAMLRMTDEMNTHYISAVAAHGTTVSCYTCHRGRAVPESKLPAAREQ